MASVIGDGTRSLVDILFLDGDRVMDGRQSSAGMDALARSLDCRAAAGGYDVMPIVD